MKPVQFIDIHGHTRKTAGFPRGDQPSFSTPRQMIDHYDRLGIERGVMLPSASPECEHHNQSVEELLELCHTWSPRFIPFCNVDPRSISNSPDAPLDEMMRYYKERGCKGIGEVVANMPFNHPMMENLFRCAEKVSLPLTFHISPTLGGNYGIFDEPGLPLLEGALRKFPTLRFLGHSQAFWAEIAPLAHVEDRKDYPKGPVTRPGRVVELMRRYPNMLGDLSAGSGHNAVSRDEAFGCEFLDEFQDRLFFGMDICSPNVNPPLAPYLRRLAEEKKISQTVFEKVARLNAIRLLEL